MSLLSRRHFCQFAGATLASLGLSQLNIQRHGKILAQSTSRKVALLVGINKYPYHGLNGCLTDLDLQSQLLIHRFGFNPNDIHFLKDEEATRQNILAAFNEYLIKHTKTDDVVIFHYSGHGSRVLVPDWIADRDNQNDKINSTFVPIDSQRDPDSNKSEIVDEIMGHTLFLLMSLVPTENITVVLDCCYSGGATRAGFRDRGLVLDRGKNIQITPKEKDFQEILLSKLKLSPSEFISRHHQGVAKGVVLAATDPDKTALDADLNGFSAGLFTYSLTQYLWQHDSTVKGTIEHTTNIMNKISSGSGQTPRDDIKVNSGYESQPIYFLNPENPPAQAVIISRKDNQAKVWLGGLDVGDVEYGTEFTVINASGSSSGKVIIKSRSGLMGEATVEGDVAPGALLQLVTPAQKPQIRY